MKPENFFFEWCQRIHHNIYSALYIANYSGYRNEMPVFKIYFKG